MKPLLMHRNRDFDLQLPLPWNADALVQDLELVTLLRAMAGEDKLVFDVARVAILSGLESDLDTVLYRQLAVKDCLKNHALITGLYCLTAEAIEGSKHQWWDLSSQYPDSVLFSSVSLLESLLGALRRLREVAEGAGSRFESEAFTVLFAMLARELNNDYLATIENHLMELKFKGGALFGAELGERNDGINYILRKPPERDTGWLRRILRKATPGYTFHLADRDELGAEMLSNIRHRGISRVAIALAQSADHVLTFFKTLRTELAFYIGCINLHDKKASKGEPLCFPMPSRVGGRKLCFSGLYDVCLSLHMEKRLVGNAADADGKSLTIITGANQGGKSSFLRSVGLAQLMMQCGMFVGAEFYSAELCPGLFTHYKREEDTTMKSGRLDEELGRLSDIVDHIVPNSMVLFNESFAATNEREGSEIAKQVVRAMLEKKIKIIFVTHLYEFAHGIYDRRMKDAIFLRAQRTGDGMRTFKLFEGEPLETSFGEDLYREIFM